MYRNKVIAVIIPAYNEEELIGKVLKTVPSFIDHIVVVDDGSSDRTGEVVKVHQEEDPRIIYRGGHRHKSLMQAAICLQASCVVDNNGGTREETFVLDAPSKCLILEPGDWHRMRNFASNAILMVLASDYFDPAEYTYEKYKD